MGRFATSAETKSADFDRLNCQGLNITRLALPIKSGNFILARSYWFNIYGNESDNESRMVTAVFYADIAKGVAF